LKNKSFFYKQIDYRFCSLKSLKIKMATEHKEIILLKVSDKPGVTAGLTEY
jgi:hypothetical protein